MVAHVPNSTSHIKQQIGFIGFIGFTGFTSFTADRDKSSHDSAKCQENVKLVPAVNNRTSFTVFFSPFHGTRVLKPDELGTRAPGRILAEGQGSRLECFWNVSQGRRARRLRRHSSGTPHLGRVQGRPSPRCPRSPRSSEPYGSGKRNDTPRAQQEVSQSQRGAPSPEGASARVPKREMNGRESGLGVPSVLWRRLLTRHAGIDRTRSRTRVLRPDLADLIIPSKTEQNRATSADGVVTRRR